MGQNFNPHALRVDIPRDWDSQWYDESKGSFYIIDELVNLTLKGRKIYLKKYLEREDTESLLERLKL